VQGPTLKKYLKTGLKAAMVENRWIAVFIVTCTVGLVVGLLRITRAYCYSLPLFVIARRSSIGRRRLCRWDWHSKI